LNIAATADAALSFAAETALWEPTVGCTAAPCLPSLTLTAAERPLLDALLADLGQTGAEPAANVLIVGSQDSSFVTSEFSEPGAQVFAVGEGIPTLLGVPVQGTSFSAPQVAGLAAYLWLLSPELRARPLADTIAAIRANASPDGLVNAYASVLSLDRPEAPTPTTARVRLALLDVDADGDFDLADLQAFHDAYVQVGAPINPSRQDFSRFDLNGDGFTGGTRATRMDLDPTGSTRFGAPQISELFVPRGNQTLTFHEAFVTDARALCFYALSGLYSGSDAAARDALLADLCPAGGALAIDPESVVVGTLGTQQFVALAGGQPTPDVAWSASAGSIDADGLFLAPAEPGLYTVTATSLSEPANQASADVEVTGGESGLYAGTAVSSRPAGATLGCGDAGSFPATVQLSFDPPDRVGAVVIIPSNIFYNGGGRVAPGVLFGGTGTLAAFTLIARVGTSTWTATGSASGSSMTMEWVERGVGLCRQVFTGSR
jgi:hypothetical protein